MLVKGNCITTCLISPGCKTICKHRRSFPSAGARGSRKIPLSFIYKPVSWGKPSRQDVSPYKRRLFVQIQLFPKHRSIYIRKEKSWLAFKHMKILPIRKQGFSKSNIFSGKMSILTKRFGFWWGDSKGKFCFKGIFLNDRTFLFRNVDLRGKMLPRHGRSCCFNQKVSTCCISTCPVQNSSDVWAPWNVSILTFLFNSGRKRVWKGLNFLSGENPMFSQL